MGKVKITAKTKAQVNKKTSKTKKRPGVGDGGVYTTKLRVILGKK